MVDTIVDSILHKEGRVEITFLFHSRNAVSIQKKKIMIPCTLQIYDFLLALRFLSR